MQGISSKALAFGGAENKIKFTSQRFDNDLDWNTYQMKWRTMDPQIGRFLQVDPLAPEYVHNSTFAYAENDVIRAIDLEGLEKYIVVNNKTKYKYWNYVERTVITQLDAKGNLINQQLRDKKTNKLLTTKDVYEANNIGKADGGRGISKTDKFIAKNGVVNVDTEAGKSQELTEQNNGKEEAYAETREIKEGESLVMSKGLYREATIKQMHSEKSTAGIMGIEFNEILTKAVDIYKGKRADVNVLMTVTINKEQKEWFDRIKVLIEKLSPNYKVEVNVSTSQAAKTASYQIMATK
jgi:RHS repeat-associated protein